MTNVKTYMFVLGLLNAQYVYCGIEEDVKIQIEQAQNTIYEENEVFSFSSRAISDWPTEPPTSAASAQFSRFNDTFDFYIWHEKDDVWVAVLPITGNPFVCSASFDIIQNGIQFDSVKLENITGNSQCGDVLVPSAVFKLTQWSYISNPVNLNQPFTIVFNSDQSLDFNPSGYDVSDQKPPLGSDSECLHASYKNGALYIPQVDLISEESKMISYEVEMALSLPSPLTFRVVTINPK